MSPVRNGSESFPANVSLPEKPSLAPFFQRWRGLKMPSGVMMPVINSCGVTSKAGLRAVLPGLATRTDCLRPLR